VSVDRVAEKTGSEGVKGWGNRKWTHPHFKAPSKRHFKTQS
jgi:hypothetical protein